MRWRVVCGFFDVMLIRSPISAFSSVDFPTEGRPTIATCPKRCGEAGGSVMRRKGGERVLGGVLLGAAPAGARAARDDGKRGIRHSTTNSCACASPLTVATA
jgi:hypothetical protein